MSLLGQIANKEVFNFLRTATIKCSYFADQSRSLHIKSNIETNIPDNELPYYKHMAGEYILKNEYTALVTNPKTGEQLTQTYGNTSLVYNRDETKQDVEIDNRLIYNNQVFDEMMTITSLDTQETIPFTLENLHAEYALDDTWVHEKTLAAYKLPSRYFDLLCERYPKQVDLIKAIVYPVKKAREITPVEQSDHDQLGELLPSLNIRRRDLMVSAANFDILNYDETLFDENERSSLTTAMKSFVKMINLRWNVKEYTYEENYAVVLWSVLWSLLPIALIVQRYANIKTPLAHSSHIWDYLISKGLESYKGYLTTDQTLFLYKNINYILQNRGQQKITNLLIDELLNDVGLNIKAKTIVLDTTETLDTEKSLYDAPLTVASQCESCSRRTECHKNITTYACKDYIGADDLCKPEPIVLTEEFAGATKQKIINLLVSQYGYTKDEAAVKYKRSTLWKDEEIEAIRLSLDRDQLTDLKGDVEELDVFIEREHNADLEPVYNEDIVEEQRHELRHIAGTYAPTKVLEVTRNTYNARFGQLFNKFLTETMLHLAPRDVNGVQNIKVSTSYTFNIQDTGSTFLLSFGELLAAMYLGTLREWSVELFYDHINPDETYKADVDYFRWQADDSSEESLAEDTRLLVNANRMKRITVTEAMIGTEVGDDVYRWAPKVVLSDNSTLPAIDGHELITKFLKLDSTTGEWVANHTYAIPIPDQVRLTTAFKFGKPVKQIDLVNAWYSDSSSYASYLKLMPSSVQKAVCINDIVYGIRAVEKTEDDEEYWDWCSFKIEIVGEVKDDTYYANNDEIPIIPRYFRWYNKHMSPEDEDKPGSISRVPAKVFSSLSFDTDEEIVDPVEITDTEKKRVYYDMRLNETYLKIETEKQLDIDGLIERYVDLMEPVSKQSVIGNYLDEMFSLLETIYSYVLCQNSVLVNDAATLFLDCCLKKGFYKVNLTNTSRRTTWPPTGSFTYPLETSQIKVATYDDWLKTNKDIYQVFQVFDSKEDWVSAWNSFTQSCLTNVTKGCTLPYADTSVDNTTVNKLKELVTHLSSYKIAFIDVANTEKGCDALNAIVSDNSDNLVSIKSYEYINPVYDSECPPHMGGYLAIGGDFYVPTTDKTAQSGKTYYKAVTTTKYETEQSSLSEIDTDLDVLTFVEQTLTEGTKLAETQHHYSVDQSTGEITITGEYFFYWGIYYEKINFYTLLGVTDKDKRILIIYDPESKKWYYQIGTKVATSVTVPASAIDSDATKSDDTYLSVSYITSELKQLSNSIVYRKQVDAVDYEWSEVVESSELKDLLDRTITQSVVGSNDTIEIESVDETSEITTDADET